MVRLATRAALTKRYEPAEDYGFFGPESVAWKVWSYPTSYVLGFIRSVTIEHLDPNLAAAVVHAGGVKSRPHTRYARTIRYFGLAAFGASEPTARAADVLVKVHSKAIGVDPVTGGEYDANNPDSQLWIHLTAWHSILYCYEKFGPGPLSAAEEAQYWSECARAAELQTIDPATVPRTREQVRRYFDQWRPRLAASEAAQDMVDFILSIDVALPPDLPQWQRRLFAPMIFFFRKGVIATYPSHIRQMFGQRQGRLTDALARIPNRLFHTALHRSPAFYMWFVETMAPAAAPVIAPVKLGIAPKNPVTMTPREAQAAYGFDVPAEAHAEFRMKQRDRVFVEHQKPSEEGLQESELLIGPMDARAASTH